MFLVPLGIGYKPSETVQKRSNRWTISIVNQMTTENQNLNDDGSEKFNKTHRFN
jgi:hypothetical protein